MTNQPHTPTTLDDLAAIINGGFTAMQKHVDGQFDERRSDMQGMKGTMQDMTEELNATHEAVRYLRRSMDMLVRNDAAQDAAINTLMARVARLEKKVGLVH
jgi:hypothetical protein